MSAPDGIILFAHGSRDPLWRAPMEAVAARIAAQQPDVMARCAYLELCSPDLPTVATEIIAAQAISTRASDKSSVKIRIIPMFLGMGKHAREDLPELVAALRSDHPGVHFEVAAPIGEDARVMDLLAQISLG